MKKNVNPVAMVAIVIAALGLVAFIGYKTLFAKPELTYPKDFAPSGAQNGPSGAQNAPQTGSH